MDEGEIKKSDWENNFIKHWSIIKHPISPGEPAIKRYSALIKKYVKGRKALLLGATYQIRDLLSELGFCVTVVDISMSNINVHAKLCKTKDRNEKLIEANWLEFKTDQRFDLVIGDAANFQLKEESYDRFFSNIKSWLIEGGVAIQMIEGNYLDEEVEIEKVVEFLKGADDEALDDYENKAHYYLGYTLHKNKDAFANVGVIEHDIRPYIESGEVSKEKFDKFSLHVDSFMASMISKEKMESYMGKHLEIIEKTPFGDTHVEECFYWIYVLG